MVVQALPPQTIRHWRNSKPRRRRRSVGDGAIRTPWHRASSGGTERWVSDGEASGQDDERHPSRLEVAPRGSAACSRLEAVRVVRCCGEWDQNRAASSMGVRELQTSMGVRELQTSMGVRRRGRNRAIGLGP